MKWWADDQRVILRSRCTARRLEIVAAGKLFAHQLAATGGDRLAIGVQNAQGAHAGHGIVEGPQPLTEPIWPLIPGVPPHHVLSQAQQRVVHRVYLALQVFVHDARLVHKLLALNGFLVTPLQP
ncbi:MAG: hypothetical protein LC097_02425 [Burkholderiales bacterium]|nr:hypothetical protein [Burkholderiales bacterium]